jgi:hypothetical protein
MRFPFSRAEFFDVFARYNESVWPAQIALYALAVIAIVLALRRSSANSRGAHVVLAILWFWMGVIYHAGFFAEINPAAILFAAVFVVQAVIFAKVALGPRAVVFAPRNNLAGWTGGGLIVLGLFVYPMMSVAAGHHYPSQPTFGLPCPTTIFTLGMLLWAIDTAPRRLFVIPLLWAVTGTAAALQLGATEDLSLTLSLAVVGFVSLARKGGTRKFHPAVPTVR